MAQIHQISLDHFKGAMSATRESEKSLFDSVRRFGIDDYDVISSLTFLHFRARRYRDLVHFHRAMRNLYQASAARPWWFTSPASPKLPLEPWDWYTYSDEIMLRKPTGMLSVLFSIGDMPSEVPTWEATTLLSDSLQKKCRNAMQTGELDLTDENIGERAWREITKIPYLHNITLCRTRIRDSDLRLLAGVTSLRTVDLSYTDITDAGLAHLRHLRQLRTLGLRKTRIGRGPFPNLAELTQLSELCLSGTELNDDGLDSVGKLTRLRILDLSSTEVKGWGLCKLGKLEDVRLLGLANTHIDGRYVSFLKELPQLELVSLELTSITDDDVNNLRKERPELEVCH